MDVVTKLAQASFASAPPNLVMPQPIESIITLVFGVAAVLIGLHAFSLSVRRRTPVPLLFLFGGLFTMMLEATADILINVAHPPIGQTNAYVTEGVAVPLYVVIAYFSYYGSLAIFLYDSIVAQTVSAATWWRLTALTAITLVIGESLFTWLGLFHFYGKHPLWIGPMPLWFEGANTASLMVPVLVLYRIAPILEGWRQYLILAIMPAVGCAAHFGAGIPAYAILGADQVAMPDWAIQASGLASIGFSVLLIWLGILLATDRLSKKP